MCRKREEEENRPSVLTFLSFRLSCKESSTSKPSHNRLYDPFGSPHRGQKPFSKREGCNRPPVLRTATL
ncbi:Uncharacterised protein [Segatella copri]|nr:Uncharacterised protein [Segatella copri]